MKALGIFSFIGAIFMASPLGAIFGVIIIFAGGSMLIGDFAANSAPGFFGLVFWIWPIVLPISLIALLIAAVNGIAEDFWDGVRAFVVGVCIAFLLWFILAMGYGFILEEFMHHLHGVCPSSISGMTTGQKMCSLQYEDPFFFHFNP